MEVTWRRVLHTPYSVPGGPVSLQKSIFPEQLWFRGGNLRVVHGWKVRD